MAGKLRNNCFALPPGVDWVPVDEALERLTSRLSCVARTEMVAIGDALNRVVAQPVKAVRDHPAHRNSAVDGYALCLDADCALNTFDVLEPVAAAGHPAGVAVAAGEALRILTGAEVPDGANAVILQEDSKVEGGKLILDFKPKIGANIRSVGEDTGIGDVVLDQGARVNPAAMAHAISVGIGKISAFKPLRIGVLSTGDEIVATGGAPLAHQVFDANRPMLLGQLAHWGYTPVDLGHVGDDADAVRSALLAGVEDCDAILTSGGASAGSEDYISAVLAEIAERHTWRIAIKPGRPLALAQIGDVPIFGLPGNPIAAFVCTLIFARPALRILQGRSLVPPIGYDLPAGFSKFKKHGRSEYPRARIDADRRVQLFASEGSGRVSGLNWADGLVELGHEGQEITEGDLVRYIPFASFD